MEHAGVNASVLETAIVAAQVELSPIGFFLFLQAFALPKSEVVPQRKALQRLSTSDRLQVLEPLQDSQCCGRMS